MDQCNNIAELKLVFGDAWRWAKGIKNNEALDELKAFYDKRLSELTPRPADPEPEIFETAAVEPAAEAMAEAMADPDDIFADY